ncbi:MAG: AMP-binding protein, partial [Chromatiales bacterium]|nr:AMP-binding protein [Chromatiales bacterium]
SSVGLPMPGIEVRIGPNDELQARSPGVMCGYWNNAEATNAMIDDEGWLSTGDQARIDVSGHITITGRIKDILVLSNGEKVPPSDMEMAIELSPLFDQVLVIGEGRPYLAALIVLNSELWPHLAESCGVEAGDSGTLSQKAVLTRVQKIISEQLKGFPVYAKVRRVYLTLEPWSVENGLLTPTMKIKRAKVIESLATEIEALYNDALA